MSSHITKASIVAAVFVCAAGSPASAGFLHLHKSDSPTGQEPTAGAAPNPAITQSSTPSATIIPDAASSSANPQPSADLAGAEDRVNKAKTQLETAKKQLTAAKALLKAAQAEYTAAQADRQALTLRTTAQGLAHDSGLKSATANDASPAQSASVAPMSGTSSAQIAQPMPDRNFGTADFGSGNATAPASQASPAAPSTDPTGAGSPDLR